MYMYLCKCNNRECCDETRGCGLSPWWHCALFLLISYSKATLNIDYCFNVCVFCTYIYIYTHTECPGVVEHTGQRKIKQAANTAAQKEEKGAFLLYVAVNQLYPGLQDCMFTLLRQLLFHPCSLPRTVFCSPRNGRKTPSTKRKI